MGSIAGRQAYPGGASYIASKFAVRGFSYALREDLLGRPIRITTVDAGLVETEFSVVRFKGDQAAADKVVRGARPGHARRGRRLRHVRAHAAPAREPRRDRDQGDRAVVGLARRAPGDLSALRAPLASTTGGSSATPSPRSARSRPSRSTCSSTPPSSATSGAPSSPRSASPRPCSRCSAMFNFLQYGTTAQVARATGAGEDVIAARLGAQCLWLSLAFGCARRARRSRRSPSPSSTYSASRGRPRRTPSRTCGSRRSGSRRRSSRSAARAFSAASPTCGRRF